MNKVTIYMPDELEEQINMAAKSAGVSKSEWIVELVKEKLANYWPQSVVDMAGTWGDFPSIVGIRERRTEEAPRDEF